MTPEEVRERRDQFAQAALTGLLVHINRDAPDPVRAAQVNAISAEAVEYADAIIARLDRTAIYPAEINPNDEAALHNARTG